MTIKYLYVERGSLSVPCVVCEEYNQSSSSDVVLRLSVRWQSSVTCLKS